MKSFLLIFVLAFGGAAHAQLKWTLTSVEHTCSYGSVVPSAPIIGKACAVAGETQNVLLSGVRGYECSLMIIGNLTCCEDCEFQEDSNPDHNSNWP